MRSCTILIASILLLCCFLGPRSVAQLRPAPLVETPAVTNICLPRLSLSVNVPALPDLTSTEGITLGGKWDGSKIQGGKFSPWGGGGITLQPSDALHVGNPCGFQVGYDLTNIGTGPVTRGYINRLREGNNIVATQNGPLLAAGQTQALFSGIYLPKGQIGLSLWIDNNNTITESKENNNYRRVTVFVNCP